MERQLVTCRVEDLRPHSAYALHNLSVPASKLSALAELGDVAFQYPLVITRDRVVIDGYGRLELAKQQGRPTVLCIEYELPEAEALRWLLQTHRPSNGFNDFIRILLALGLEPSLHEKARVNQKAGGQNKGSSKLSEAERIDVRKELAQIAGVSVGNVSKVKHILANACGPLQEAIRSGEVSINLSGKWSHEPQAQQLENLRLLRIERGIRRKVRHLVANHLAKISRANADECIFNLSDLAKLINRLASMSPDEPDKLSPVVVGVVNVPGRGIFVTEGLLQTLEPQQEVLIK